MHFPSLKMLESPDAPLSSSGISFIPGAKGRPVASFGSYSAAFLLRSWRMTWFRLGHSWSSILSSLLRKNWWIHPKKVFLPLTGLWSGFGLHLRSFSITLFPVGFYRFDCYPAFVPVRFVFNYWVPTLKAGSGSVYSLCS